MVAVDLIFIVGVFGGPEGLAAAGGLDIAITGAVGKYENLLGVASLATTLASDWLRGYTYKSNGDLYVGKNSLVSLTTMAVGLVPEGNIDAWASTTQSAYDLGQTNPFGNSGGSINVSRTLETYFFGSR